ncbi:MAG TPA: primosomal protein N' [Cytophagales bacterium]|nr:primosomal protein N' [Cytophagales bacterium]
MDRLTLFADVILPVPIPKLFTYRVAFEMNDHIEVGSRVIVQFGQKKILTAIVRNLHETPPKEYEAKTILELLDDGPLVNEIQLQHWEWVANYYMCTIGEVMNAALPAGLKLNSQSSIQLNPDVEINEASLSDKELLIIEELRGKPELTYDETAAIAGVKNIYKHLKSLLEKNAILLFEQVKEKYKPKIVKKVRLGEQYANSKDTLESLLNSLETKPKHIDVLLYYLREIPVFKNPDLNQKGLEKSLFRKEGVSESALNTLIKNGIFEDFEINVSRFSSKDPGTLKEVTLSNSQKEARAEIIKQFENQDVVLLHGITGSGKTEIYTELVQAILDQGYQALFLLPEIALTTQIVQRLYLTFGNKMGVYHSKFSDNERVEIFKNLREGKIDFVVGVRSALFLPFANLGLIIVDEEHDSSFKQYDPAPRYNARDASIVLAGFHQAKVLLGSATPSVESYYQAKEGKFGLVNLLERFGEAQLPEMVLVDTSYERKTHTLKSEFTSTLLEALDRTVKAREQSILFQNRRGYSPYINCEDCNWIPKCQNCDVSLTYHMYNNELRCHYCGFKTRNYTSCAACGSVKLKTVGMGTEKIEDDLKLYLPEARIQRMDLDTTRKKYSYQQIISDFERGGTDILVGTQMVSKGLDFDKVSLVAVFDADRMIHFPDFRAQERTFQLITQVSGRAGRRGKKGKVVIQTANVNQPILKKIAAHDYQSFFIEEISEREKFLYPPFVRLIKISVKANDRVLGQKAAEVLAKLLLEKFGSKRILGPESPIIDKIRNLFLKDILIKLERGKINLTESKKLIAEAINKVSVQKEFRNIHMTVDVDPV